MSSKVRPRSQMRSFLFASLSSSITGPFQCSRCQSRTGDLRAVDTTLATSLPSSVSRGMIPAMDAVTRGNTKFERNDHQSFTSDVQPWQGTPT
ncbi:hypothetical protein M413DRAFT_321399 [Hebeloma cylindrosporum]|uniref:Uncharacterized protein n=1 Tax=Hebeloma cylindrosporum TaxID=76867 RepID=A0A0C3BH40_HEBCY|nr:hypothetical protein M413DRAFT_321399 [Hebeloma cylindrosporum h7]